MSEQKTETTTTTETPAVAVVDTPVVAAEEKKPKIKKIVLTSTGSGSDYSNLAIKEEDYPKLDAEKPNQVIVRVKASGLNFAELMQRQGLYKPSIKTPYTPGYEASGVIEELGSGVTDLTIGDRVIVMAPPSLWKECVCVPRAQLIRMPEEMSFEEGAGMVVNYITAYQILFRQVNLQPNDVVLIHMAAGGVGFAATQLCKTVEGVKVIGTASPAKHDAIRANGVDHPIDYTTQSYEKEIRKLYPDGIDVVLDPMNGENAIKGFDLLVPLGRICHFGASSMTAESKSLVSAFKTWWKCLSVNSMELMSENKSVSGYHLGVMVNNPRTMAKACQDMEKIITLWKEKKVKLQIDSEFPYSKIGEAMKKMHARGNVGKIILKPDCEWKEPIVAEETAATTSSIAETKETVKPVETEQITLSTEEKEKVVKELTEAAASVTLEDKKPEEEKKEEEKVEEKEETPASETKKEVESADQAAPNQEPMVSA